MEQELFPLFMKMAGRACLVVGAGRVAEGKIESLVRCGASVRVVAPAASEAIRQAAQAGEILWEQRSFLPSDLAGVFLVIAATPSRELHEQIFRQAQRDGILCNAVDEPERCDFYYPAMVRRGPLQIAISTGGRSPLLAQRLRQELEQQFAPEYGTWTEEIGRVRTELMAQDIDPEERRERLRELSSDEAFREFLSSASTAQGGDRRKQGAKGKVYFLGAGPGDPELLTRKAWRILSSAEVVLHDALVAPEILWLARADALVCDVGKRCGRKSIRQEEIHALLIAHASEGRTLVRLQGGDPLIFGRAGEEMTALRSAGIDFEIVPGVTAVSAAAAAAQIPLTDRRIASKLIFLSAHRHDGENAGTGASAVPSADATLAVYMPGSDYARVARELLDAGWPGDTPCLIVSKASTSQQRFRRTDIASLPKAEPMPAPAVLVIGKVTVGASRVVMQDENEGDQDRAMAAPGVNVNG
jgi:uroporphyrin-III C-methyltransferase/precorrin-2 dehydrogenase/sirohydrochlorin ferrochelatase